MNKGDESRLQYSPKHTCEQRKERTNCFQSMRGDKGNFDRQMNSGEEGTFQSCSPPTVMHLKSLTARDRGARRVRLYQDLRSWVHICKGQKQQVDRRNGRKRQMSVGKQGSSLCGGSLCVLNGETTKTPMVCELW